MALNFAGMEYDNLIPAFLCVLYERVNVNATMQFYDMTLIFSSEGKVQT